MRVCPILGDSNHSENSRSHWTACKAITQLGTNKRPEIITVQMRWPTPLRPRGRDLTDLLEGAELSADGVGILDDIVDPKTLVSSQRRCQSGFGFEQQLASLPAVIRSAQALQYGGVVDQSGQSRKHPQV